VAYEGEEPNGNTCGKIRFGGHYNCVDDRGSDARLELVFVTDGDG
jgi:hypothetical protein